MGRGTRAGKTLPSGETRREAATGDQHRDRYLLMLDIEVVDRERRLIRVAPSRLDQGWVADLLRGEHYVQQAVTEHSQLAAAMDATVQQMRPDIRRELDLPGVQADDYLGDDAAHVPVLSW